MDSFAFIFLKVNDKLKLGSFKPSPATDHRQMSDAELDAAGVGADLIRLSCGLENSEDLIADIAQALQNV